MAQRTAIARALVRRPSILLLDEPFSALDSFTRQKLHQHLLALWERSRFTLVFVTHDVLEAVTLSDSILVMRGNTCRIQRDRKSVVTGKSVSVRVDLGGSLIRNKKKQKRNN